MPESSDRPVQPAPEAPLPPSAWTRRRVLTCFGKTLLVMAAVPVVLMGLGLHVNALGLLVGQSAVHAPWIYGALFGLPAAGLLLVLAAVFLRGRRRWWLLAAAVTLGFLGWLMWDSSAVWTRIFRKAVAGADRLRVRSGGSCHRNPAKEEALIEVSGAARVREIADRVCVTGKPPGCWGACMCCGWPTMEFYRDGQLIATVSCHHGRRLRLYSGGWPGDADLTDESAALLNKWLDDNGASEEKWREKQSQGAAGDPAP